MTARALAVRLIASVVIIIAALRTTASATADSSALPAKWTALTFDTARTTIAYKLIGWPHVTDGTFKLKSGRIRVDAISGKMAGEIVVDATSGDSGHSVRDARMKSSVLEVDRYPEISFAPQQVESHGVPRGAFPVVVRGVMTLHGEPHPFTITATVERHGDDAMIQCRFAIPYVAWGLNDPSVLFFKVEQNVSVEVTAIAHVANVRSTTSLGGERFLARDDAAAQRIRRQFP
jgi:polyisoprenoid-binding protein YceI